MNFKTLFINLFTALTFIACGGGSEAYFKGDETKATAVVLCNNASTSWTSVQSGDSVNATQNSQLKFDHDSNGQKQVCVVSGSATISKKDS